MTDLVVQGLPQDLSNTEQERYLMDYLRIIGLLVEDLYYYLSTTEHLLDYDVRYP
jgi:hypothetical protein